MSEPTPAERQEGARSGPVPGWYDDPEAPGRPRWWDGERWGPSTAPPQVVGVEGHGLGYGTRRHVDLVQEHRWARMARVVVILGFIAYAGSAILGVLVFAESAKQIEEVYRSAVSGEIRFGAMFGGTATGLAVLSQALGLLTIAGGVLFLVWFHRAATNARNLGLVQRLSPVWGVAGFVASHVVPLILSWLPYLSIVDLFPRGHAGRRSAGIWWVAWFGAQAAGIAVMVPSMVTYVSWYSSALDSMSQGGDDLPAFPAAGATPFMWVAAAVQVACYAVAALALRRTIAAALDVHRGLAERAGIVAVGFDPGAPAMASEAVDPWARAREAAKRSGPWAGPDMR